MHFHGIISFGIWRILPLTLFYALHLAGFLRVWGHNFHMEWYRSGHNGTDSKSVEPLLAPWVRIPPTPLSACLRSVSAAGFLLWLFCTCFQFLGWSAEIRVWWNHKDFNTFIHWLFRKSRLRRFPFQIATIYQDVHKYLRLLQKYCARAKPESAS